jgi:hypothetical protein
VAGDPITVCCDNAACGYALEHRRQYRSVLTATDWNFAEKYGAAVTLYRISQKAPLSAFGATQSA